MKKLILSTTSILLYSVVTYAIPTTTTQLSVNKLPKGYAACPSINKLIKNPQNMRWGTRSGWRSTGVSFTNKVDKFLGAQWTGINVGNVTCIYQGASMTFTINLLHPGLVEEPSGGKWSKDKGGYKDCISHNIKQCIFKAFTKKSNKNIYQQLNSLRGSGQNQQQDGL